MSNNLNLSDSINFAISSGKTPTFIYNGTTYEFSPQGLINFLTAEGGFGASGDISVNSIIINTDAASIDSFGNLTAAQVTTSSLLTTGAVVTMENLPTADPGNAGQLWNSSGTLMISTGA